MEDEKYAEEFTLAGRIIDNLANSSEEDQVKLLFGLFCRALSINETQGMLFFWISSRSAAADLDEFSALIDDPIWHIESDLFSLRLNQLVESQIIEGGAEVYSVSQSNINHALNKYIEFRKNLKERAEKKGCAESDILFLDSLTKPNISGFDEKHFATELLMRPLGQIASFILDNHLLSLPASAQRLFWDYCHSYLLHFVSSGVEDDDDDDSSSSNSDIDCLIERGWVDTFTEARDEHSLEKKDNYCLSASAAKQLFRGIAKIPYHSVVSTLGTFILHGDIEPKPLFFNLNDSPQINQLYEVADLRRYAQITSALERWGLKSSMTVILYGPSGTGKTELVRQVARKTGRDLLMVDAAKLYGSYWGEDERNVRALFRMYRHMEALSDNAPILFIDECDGVLGKRVINATTRGDRSNNVVQNIFLEEMNLFRGLLFVTTNSISNLDPAMDRRFLLKLKFHAPDEQTRARIWRSKVPELSAEKVASIAREYVLTGAQIENIVTRASIDEILNAKNNPLSS